MRQLCVTLTHFCVSHATPLQPPGVSRLARKPIAVAASLTAGSASGLSLGNRGDDTGPPDVQGVTMTWKIFRERREAVVAPGLGRLALWTTNPSKLWTTNPSKEPPMSEDYCSELSSPPICRTFEL